MKYLRFQYGPWALVTGASSGIGKEFAQQLATNGLNVVLVARRKYLLDQLATEIEREYQVGVRTVQADLTDPRAIGTLEEETMDLDIGLLVNNAGAANGGPFLKRDADQETKLVQLNIVAPMKLAHHYGRKMSERGSGGIIFVSSMMGHQAVPYMATYAANKAYLLSLGESLEYELKKKGVDVTVVSPGLTDTPMARNVDGVDFSKTPFTLTDVEEVVQSALKALGKKPSVIPGVLNNVVGFMGNRLLGRKRAMHFFGGIMEKATAPGHK